MTTKQLKVILEKLKQFTTHPTADEIYYRVRQEIPNISLGTVYRNLNHLADNDEILMLGRSGQQKRFDANVNQHYHFACKTCGKYYDLPFSAITHIKQSMDFIREHEVHGYELEFYGICSTCKHKEKSYANST